MKKKTLQIVIAVALICCLFLFPIAGSIYTDNVPKRYQSEVVISVPDTHWVDDAAHFNFANIPKAINVVQTMFKKMNVRGNVQQIPTTDLLHIIVQDTNPKRAADMANAAAFEMLAKIPAKVETAAELQFSKPAKIWARAEPATAPIFPNITFNTMVSFIAGIICAVCGRILLFFAMKKEKPPLLPGT